jgi:hypothetical protein
VQIDVADEADRPLAVEWLERVGGPRGAGADVMRDLTQLADADQREVQLLLEGGADNQRLADYYRQFGFDLDGGADVNPEGLMYRNPLAVRPAAVEQPLALPAPAEPLPSFAAKPRGGQWWSDREINGANFSPENAARSALPANLRFSTEPQDAALQDWWQKALSRYLRNDFATENDPLRGLAEQGLLHTELSPDEWSRMAGQSFVEDRIGPDIVLPNNPQGGLPGAGNSFHAEVLQAMPWLARQPMTDNIYGVSSNSLGGLDFAHVADEMYNAMRPEISGIPADLAVRPESLQRMAFPQAVERVGRINQWRAAQQAEASLAAQDNPALRTFRDYAEDNPRGLRWMEIAPPELNTARVAELEAMIANPPEGFDIMAAMRELRDVSEGGNAYRQPLQDALTYEGDTMGHCVGGYCDDVLSGRTRIFSLRDARGEPHVTVETRPGATNLSVARLPEAEQDRYRQQAIDELGLEAGMPALNQRIIELAFPNPVPQDIIQIKGKQNRAPNDEYLPFVQDFVRQGQWGNIGDLGNTGLTRLPDGRYITLQQAEEGIAAIPETTVPMQFGLDDIPPTMMPRVYDPTALDRLAPEEWEGLSQYFQGYAIGGRVDPERCFTRHRLSVKR